MNNKITSEILNQITARKSVRVYEDKLISLQSQQAILQAAIQAPSAGNMLLYSILNITDQNIKDQLAVSCDNQPFIAKAPLVLIFVADYQRWYDSFKMVQQLIAPQPLRKPGEGDMLLACCDALIAAQNTVVAAESMGIGSCYIGDIMEKYEFHKQLLKLPKYALPVCMLCFGYPTQQQKDRQKPIRFSQEYLVFENEYQRQSPQQLEAMFTKQAAAQECNSKYNMQESVGAKLKRKWNCSFSEEMSRSVAQMIASWKE